MHTTSIPVDPSTVLFEIEENLYVSTLAFKKETHTYINAQLSIDDLSSIPTDIR